MLLSFVKKGNCASKKQEHVDWQIYCISLLAWNTWNQKRFIVLVLKIRYKDYIWCMSFTLQIAHRLFSKTHAFSLLKSTPTKFFKYLLNNPGAKILINTKYFEELKRCNVVGFRQLRSKPLRSACICGRLSAGENVDLLNSVLLLSCTILDCFHEVPGERWFRKTAAANRKKVK